MKSRSTSALFIAFFAAVIAGLTTESAGAEPLFVACTGSVGAERDVRFFDRIRHRAASGDRAAVALQKMLPALFPSVSRIDRLRRSPTEPGLAFDSEIRDLLRELESEIAHPTLSLFLAHPRGPLDAFIVSTHQMPQLQAATARMFSQPRFRNVPRLALASPVFAVVSAEYVRGASRLDLSHGGGLSFPISARHIYLAGGYAGLCLANTVKALVLSARRLGQTDMTLHYFTDLVYVEDGSLAGGDVRRVLGDAFGQSVAWQVPVGERAEQGSFETILSGDPPLRLRVDFERARSASAVRAGRRS